MRWIAKTLLLLCFVLLNSIRLNLLCVWILFRALAVILVSEFWFLCLFCCCFSFLLLLFCLFLILFCEREASSRSICLLTMLRLNSLCGFDGSGEWKRI